MPISFAGMLVESVDTDASGFGYGWFWKSDIFSDSLPVEWQDQHINVTELWTPQGYLAMSAMRQQRYGCNQSRSKYLNTFLD